VVCPISYVRTSGRRHKETNGGRGGRSQDPPDVFSSHLSFGEGIIAQWASGKWTGEKKKGLSPSSPSSSSRERERETDEVSEPLRDLREMPLAKEE